MCAESLGMLSTVALYHSELSGLGLSMGERMDDLQLSTGISVIPYLCSFIYKPHPHPSGISDSNSSNTGTESVAVRLVFLYSSAMASVCLPATLPCY